MEHSVALSFREKASDDKDLPRVQPLEGGMKKRYGSGTILIPAVSEVAALMRKVPRGKITTINKIREVLADEHGATVACPIVTGIHARVVAGAAGEEEAEGKKRVAPYWRTLKSDGELNAKYPGGIAHQREKLEQEGLSVSKRGKRYFVDHHEQLVANI